MKLWDIIRHWLIRRKIGRTVRECIKENCAAPSPLPDDCIPEKPEEPTTPANQVLHYEFGFQVTPQMVREIARFQEDQRQARRCRYLAAHSKRPRVRKKNAKRAVKFDRPLVLHIPHGNGWAWQPTTLGRTTTCAPPCSGWMS